MEENHSQISRREALKALAASGGALAAAAFLPGKWAKPLVEAGVLPAHAQGSTNCPQPFIEEHGSCATANCNVPGAQFYADVRWLPDYSMQFVSLTFGGAPAEIVDYFWSSGIYRVWFNPGVGAQGFNAVLKSRSFLC